MLRRTSIAAGSAALVMCVLQGCSSGGNTNQASPGGSQTPAGSPAASNAGSQPAPSSPAASSPTSPASQPTSPASTAGTPTPLIHPTPASSRTAASGSSRSGTFTAPAASSAVEGHGNYQVINPHRVYVQVCAKKVGTAYAVGVEAIAYNSSYSEQGEIASVILPETPGQQGCTHAYLLYTDHLKVYTFIGQGGTITKKSKVKSIY
jgi:hypothetical protein